MDIETGSEKEEEMKEQRYLDRTGWPEGPWTDEPDRVSWRDEQTGLPCLVLRNPHLRNLCGYVAVPPGHPWHGKGYDDVEADVHGGLTFAGACQEDTERGVCHVPEPGEPDDVWWLGFDMAHFMDLVPYEGFMTGLVEKFAGMSEPLHYAYRDVEYVKAECASVALQARAAASCE